MSYEDVFEMDEINETFEQTNVALIIGTSDTVNIAAESNPSCAIAGMPVLKEWNAKKLVALKKSMNVSGYAGTLLFTFLKLHHLILSSLFYSYIFFFFYEK